MYRIFFTGAHSTGKTEQAKYFVKKYPEYHLAKHERRQLVKDGIINVNETATPWDELIMAGDYLKAIISTPVPSLHERCWIDKLAYAQCVDLGDKKTNDEWQHLMHYTLTKAFPPLSEVDKFIYFPPYLDILGDGIRNTDLKYQQEVDFWIQFYLRFFNIEAHSLESQTIQDRHIEIASVLGLRY